MHLSRVEVPSKTPDQDIHHQRGFDTFAACEGRNARRFQPSDANIQRVRVTLLNVGFGRCMTFTVRRHGHG